MRPAFAVGEALAPSPYPSLAGAILAGVEQFPDGRFVYVGPAGQMRERAYRDTLGQALGLVAGLRGSGVRAGDPLLVDLADPADIVPALWAAVLGGFVAIPAGSAAGSATADNPAGDRLVFLAEVFGQGWLLTDRAAQAGHRDPAILDFRALLAHAPIASDQVSTEVSAQALRFAIQTSGTTARPRLVGLSDSASLARWWPQMPDAAHARGFLSWTSFGHVMGVGLAMPNLPLKAHLEAGRFVAEPLSWLDALAAVEATHATMTNFGMTLVLKAVAEHPERRWQLDHVRKIGIGAEAISRRTSERFLACLAGFGLRDDALILGYGLSECGPVVGGGIAFSPGKGEEADESGAPPELDRPTRGHAVRIVGDNGYLLREGEVGRIEVRGPTMTSGYLGDDAATAGLFTSDQWLRTGDLGRLRDGRLTVVGREKELVIVNARKYSCESIEAAIRARSAFHELHVAPFDEPDAGADGTVGAPCAVFVVVDRPAEAALPRIAQAVRAATAEAFRFAPKVVAVVSGDEVPRTALGKVRRLALAGLLADPQMAGRSDRLAASGAAMARDTGGADSEARIERIWRELLGGDGAIDRDADFFALGGDSLLALRMSFMLEGEFGIPVRFDSFPEKLSVAELARLVSVGMPAAPAAAPPAGEAQAAGDDPLPGWFLERLRGFLADWPGTPVVADGLVRRVGSARQGLPVFWCMQHAEEAQGFERTVGQRLPAYVMRSGMWLLNYDTSLATALVDRYLAEIRAACPAGPLVVGGICQGVNIALALVRRLVAEGRDVRLLAAADCRFAELCNAGPVPVPVALFAALGSKFNPWRFFRHPEVGLRKLAPCGLRLERIDAGYARMMFDPAMAALASGLEAAIDWAEGQASRAGPMAIPSPTAMYQRRLSTPLKSLALEAGEKLGLAVRLKNTSPIAWAPFDSSGLALGNHWLSEQGEMLVWADGRTPLERPLAPGERAYLTLDVVAPSAPGDYLLEVDLVEEGICWFADFALGPLQIPVRVVAPAGGGKPDRSRYSILAAAYRLADRQPLLTRASKPK